MGVARIDGFDGAVREPQPQGTVGVETCTKLYMIHLQPEFLVMLLYVESFADTNSLLVNP